MKQVFIMTLIIGLNSWATVQQTVTVTSNIFRITSVGEVGDARTEIHVVMDFSKDPTGRIIFWKIR